MILLEKALWLIRCVARFFVWLITARDCEHCENRRLSWLSGNYGCTKDYDLRKECLNTVTRCHFERRQNK